MCFVFIWEQTATCATYSINWLGFITARESVYSYSAVRTGPLTEAVCVVSLKGYCMILQRLNYLNWLNYFVERRGHSIMGDFAKLQRTTVRFVVFVRSPVRPQGIAWIPMDGLSSSPSSLSSYIIHGVGPLADPFQSHVGLSLTLNPLKWKIRWAPNNASRWQMGLNSAFKGLSL